MERIPLVVVGAGAAGTAAAVEAAKAGVKVTLIDENPIDMYMMGLDSPLFYGQRLMPTLRNKAVMLERVVGASPGLGEAEEAGVDVRLGTYVWGAFRNMETSRTLDGPQLGLADSEKSWVVGYDRLIVASGSRDLGLSFEGWNMAGAMGAGGASSLMERYQALTSQKMVVLGSGNLGLGIAKMARERGVEVVGVVDVSPTVRGDDALRAELEAGGVTFYTSHVIKEASSSTDEIESVALVEVDGEGNAVSKTEKAVACDTVCLAVGMVPSIELPHLLFCDIELSKEKGGYVPVVDDWMRTSVETVFVAGAAAGWNDAMALNPDIAQDQGRLAGIAAAESLGAIDSATAIARRSELANVAAPSNGNEVDGVWRKWQTALINVGGLDLFACQCEEVTIAELLDVAPPRYLNWQSEQMSKRNLQTLLNDGPVSPDEIKRLTRAGMGHCQGRRCREQIAMLLAAESNTDLLDVPVMTYRPPVRPLPLRIMWADDEPQQMRDAWPIWFISMTEALQTTAEDYQSE